MDEFMGSLILGLLVFGLIAVLVFLITRAFWCWYWKISARLEEQQKTNLYLEAITSCWRRATLSARLQRKSF